MNDRREGRGLNGSIYLLDDHTVVVGASDWNWVQCREYYDMLTSTMPDYRWLVLPLSFAAFDSRGMPELADRAAALATDLTRLWEAKGG